MRIGLFGGTFNPIHRCHLVIASQARERAGLDRILFVPSGDPPHKPTTSLAPARDRYAMVQLAIGADPAFAVSDAELRRPAKSYSIDTVQSLRAELGPSAELFFVLGLDAFLEFPTWRRATELLGLCHFIVVSRPGVDFASLADFPLFPPQDRQALVALDRDASARLDIKVGTRSTVICLPLPPCRISASDIRRRLQRGERLPDLLPAEVESYIIRHQLYREPPRGAKEP